MDERKLRELAEEFDTTDQSDAIDRAEPGEPTEVTPMIVTSMRLPEPVMTAVRTAARERGVKATQLMREWIEERAAAHMQIQEATIPASALLALVAEHAPERPG